MKQFAKFFIITFLLCMVVITSVSIFSDKIGNARPFQPKFIMANDLPRLVDENSPFFQAFQDSNRVNILLMGINTNLTDTLLLASYDMTNQQVDLISIPRDTYYERENAKYPADKKINSAYHDDKALGSAKAVSDVLMGIPIHFYMEIDYKGVGEVVDALGGVPVNIPFRMYYTDPKDDPPLEIDFQPGEQVLKGEDAIKFLRFRKGNKGYRGYPEGDVGRIAAQQEFMKSAFKQAMSLKLPSVINTVMKNVESDLTVETALEIAKNAANLPSDAISTYTLPGVGKTGEGKLSFYFRDDDKIEDMLMQIYSPAPATTQGSIEGDTGNDKGNNI